MIKNKKLENVDENRRKFLKIIFVGSGVLLMERVLGPLFSRFSGNSKTSFKNFRVTENNKRLSIYDSSGEEIFQIDKGA